MNKERAATYLGNGVKPGEVARIMGCSPGYLSQLINGDEEFQLLVKKHQTALDGDEAAEEKSIHLKYVGLEHRLIDAIGDSIANAELRDQIVALKVVADRQDKVATRKMPRTEPGGGNGMSVTVQLMLPQHAIPQQPVVVLNSKSEVVSIDDKPMAPMSSDGVAKMFKANKAAVEVAKIKSLEQEI